MKSTITRAIFAVALFTLHTATAQNREFPNAISAKLNFLDYGAFYNSEPHIGQGFEVMYLRNVHKYVNIGIPGRINTVKLPTNFGKNMLSVSGDVIAQISNTESESRIMPYAFIGAGLAHDNIVDYYLQVPLGAGVQYKLGKYASIAAQVDFRKALADNRDNAQASVGFFYLLHKPDPSRIDQDRDGTPDALDKCPTIPGPSTALGCPDDDKDGVANAEDKCPTQPGPLETAGCPDADNDGYPDTTDKCPDMAGTLEGCPDRDKDGFADDKDECPTVAGRWNGCPDTDLDGVADKDDKCPNEAGTAENMGCPEKKMPADSDGDGFNDEEDICINEAGPLRGCPDVDGDGIADKDDKCPEEKGTVENMGCPAVATVKDSDGDGFPDDNDACVTMPGTVNGCPDADKDGVADKDDFCPNNAGTVKTKGCPDTDNDGIADKDDKCPTTAGVAENGGCPKVVDTDKDGIADENDACPTEAGTLNGCPDTDKDGIADKDDMCPNDAGKTQNKGCPDTDNDGIADKDDMCPTEAGKAATKGCPDGDSDGVADKDDKCPTKPGPFEGCPDSDGDGVADHKDKCPNTPAVTADGCPAKPVTKDTDGDGVDDSIDRCPTTAGLASNSGCPEIRKETKERLEFATQAVQFETSKANLKSESFAILDEIVDIMRQYPDYTLAISGHTDNVGDDDANLKLSTERAKTCYDYLRFRGIKSERLRYAGFGEMRPLADNETPSGREVNRRVEFELTLD